MLMSVRLSHVTLPNIQLFLTGKHGNVIPFNLIANALGLEYLTFFEG